MDNIERTMQFILDMQAKHEVWLQRHQEAIARIEAAVESNTARITQLVDVSLSLARHAEETDRRIRESGEETDRRIKELTESQAHSDRRLDALIDAVDKLVRGNGDTPQR